MIRLEDKYGDRPYNWRTKRVGHYIVLCFEMVLVTPLTYAPIYRETVIGKVAGNA